MNRIYKSFFSKQLGRYVVASEKARTRTKTSKKTTVAAAVVTTLGITFSAGALANPDIPDFVPNANEIVGSNNTVTGEVGNIVVGKYNGVSGNDNNVIGINNKSWDIFSEEANEDENSAVFDFFTLNNSNGEPTDGNNIFGAENYYRGSSNVITGQRNLIDGNENNAVGTDNLTAGEYNSTFGRYNYTSGLDNVNVGQGNYVHHAYSTSTFGRYNESVDDVNSTVIGRSNRTESNADSFIAGTDNRVDYLYGTNVVGLNNNVSESSSGGDLNMMRGYYPGEWFYTEYGNGDGTSYREYQSGKTNVFGTDNNVASSYTTVVGNNNMGQNAQRYEEAFKFAAFGPEIIDSDHEWRAEDIVQDYYRWSKTDNSVVTGNDNIFGGDTSIHGLANNIYGQYHNVTGAHNTTYGENNNIHGAGNRVGEVRYENVWGQYYDWYSGEYKEGDIWTPTGLTESYANNVVGSGNTVVGNENSIMGNRNQSQYTTQPGQPIGGGPKVEVAMMAMASPIGGNIIDATSNGAFGYDQFSETTNASAVVGSGNIFGDYSNVIGSDNQSLGRNNSSVGNNNSLAGYRNNVLGSGNFTGGIDLESSWSYNPEFGYFEEITQEKVYASSGVTAVGNDNKAIGLGHAIVGNSNTLIGAPNWENDFYSGGNNRMIWDYMDDDMRPGEWLNSPYFYSYEGDIAGGYYSNVIGSYNNIGTTYSTTLGNSNHVEGHSVNTLGNLNEVYGTNNSVVGNGNMMAAERTNILGNNNWNSLVLVSGVNEDGYPELGEYQSTQYAQGMWDDWLNEGYAPYEGYVPFEKMETALNLLAASPYLSYDDDSSNLVKNSDIVGSHNIVFGDRLLVAGQGNIVEGYRQTVIGHDNIAAGEKAVVLGTANTAISNMLVDISEEEIELALEEAPQVAPYLENSHNYSPVAVGSRNQTMNGGIALGTNNTARFEGIAIGHNNMAAFGNIALGSGVLSMGETLSNEAFYVGGIATNQLAIGSNGNDMRITGVAAGSNPNDAVNVEQLTAVVNDINPKGNVKYKPILDDDGNNVLDEKGLKTYDFSVVELATKATVETEDKYKVSVVEEGTGTVIENVGNATQADHAVNKGQLDYAIAGVQDGLDGTVKYGRDGEGKIDFTNVILATETVKGTDANGTDYVVSGGSTINNVATATEYHQAINKGQFDQGLDALRDGAVMYALNGDGTVNKGLVNLAGVETSISSSNKYNVAVVTSGGTVLNNVANATEADHAVNKGQMDLAIAGVADGINGAVKYERDADGNINFDKAVLEGTQTVIAADEKYKDVQIVKSGGTVIDNVANATEADHAVNKGQMDVAIAGVQDGLNGAVKYERDENGNINYDKAILEGKQTVVVADSKYKDVSVVTSGGTVIDNVANATEADHAVNKGQMDLAIAGVQDGIDGAVKYGRDGEGNIDFTNVVLATVTEKGTDANGTDYVKSGGTTINNVATATEYHQAINKGQFDQGLNALRDGTVMYALHEDGSINKNIVNLMGAPIVIGESYGVQVVVSGGTTINNVAKATEAHQAINKGQLDEAIAQVYLENDGASVKYDITNGGIDYKNVTLKNDVVLGTDQYGVQIVTSGGTNINNVATATEAHQAVNKGQMDSEFAKRDDQLAGTVQYDRNSDNSINYNQVTLAGDKAVVGVNEMGVEVVTSGGTVLANVANATEAHHAINKGQFDEAIARLEAETEGTVKYDKNEDGTIDYSNITLAGEKVVVEKNEDGVNVVVSGGTTINNVANATEAHQAINKGQFDEALSKIEGESAGNVKYDKNEDGSINYNNVTYAGDKAVIEKNELGVDVVVSGGTTVNNVANATEAHQAINKGQFDDGLARLEDGSVQYARNEDGTVNKNLVVLGGDKAIVVKNEAGIDVVKSGGTAINNVATATEAHQAINKGQFDEGLHQVRDYADQGDINTLNNANAYTNNRVDALWDAFRDESKDLRAGIAGALAVGNLPQPSEAGYSMFSMGVATYKGEQAVAMGLSAVTEDKRYVFKIAATTNTRNDTGGAASVGMQWK